MALSFNFLPRFVIVFLPRSKCLLISWLQSPSAVILEPKKIKSVTVSIVSPSIFHEVMRPDAKILVFWKLSFKTAFSLSSFTFIKEFFSSSMLSAIRVVSSAYLRLLIFLPAILILPGLNLRKRTENSAMFQEVSVQFPFSYGADISWDLLGCDLSYNPQQACSGSARITL